MSQVLPVAATKGQPLDIKLEKSDVQAAAARTIVAYGDSGTYKSTNARFFAQYLFEKTGKPVRLISAEDSSKIVFQPLIEIGVVEPVFMTKVREPLVMLRRLARGEWPTFNEKGEAQWQPLEKWRGNVSGYIIEGLSSISEQLLEDQRDNHRFLREQKSDAFEIGSEKFAVASQTAIGFVQMEMLRHLRSFGSLPVDRVLWTAHEAKGKEEDSGLPIRGPALVGTAKTAGIQKYCGVLLHFDTVQGKVRVYYEAHPDPTFPNLNYKAKTTIPAEQIAELRNIFKGGYFEPTPNGGLDKFLEVEEKLVAASASNLGEWKEKVLQKHAQKSGL